MKTKYFTIAATALALVACDKNNDDFNIDNTKDTPITIASAGVAELSTRAIDTILNTLEGEDATLGLCVSHEQDKYKADHEKYVHNFSSREWEFDLFGKDNEQMLFNGNSFDWIAYSPYSITVGETTTNLHAATTFSVPTDGKYASGKSGSTYFLVSTVDGSQYDLLWGKGTSTSATLDLTLSHVLTKLTVNITSLGSDIADGTTISSIKIGGSIPTGTLNLTGATTAAGVVTIPAEDAVAAADITALQLESPQETYVASYEALIIPQTAALTLKVKLSDDREFTKTLSSHAFESGNHYRITLQVGQDNITLGDITASPWENNVGGELETE